MDSSLSSKVAYYTGLLCPEMEGISKELFSLASHFESTILGISNLQGVKIDFKKKVFGFPAKWYYLSRLVTFMMSGIHKINHIYDSLDNWVYLSSIIPKRTILTAVTGNVSLPLRFYKKLDYIVVDNEAKRQILIEKGIDPSKIKIIYPGIELDAFLNLKGPTKHSSFTVLFASAPPTKKELYLRGVFDLLCAAESLPYIKFIFVWRPWGDTLDWIKSEIKKRKLDNLTLITTRLRNIEEIYKKAHVIVAPFKENGGKSCPTSVIEGLAAGRPAVLGPGVGIRDIIVKKGTGISFDGCSGLCESILTVMRNYDDFSRNTKDVARELFSLENFIKSYQQLYMRLLYE